MIRCFLTLIIAAVLCWHVSAQQALEKLYDVGTGLPFQEVTGMHTDKNGFLWIEYSNQEYTSRFDGITWTHYRFSDHGMPPGLALDRETKDGLWFIKINYINKTTELILLDYQWQWHYYNVGGIVVSDPFRLSDNIAYCDNEYRIHQFADSSFTPTGIVLPRQIIGDDYLFSIVHIDDHTFMINLTKNAETTFAYKFKYYDFEKKSVIYTDSTDVKDGVFNLFAPFKYFKNSDTRYGYDIKADGLIFPVKGFSTPQPQFNLYYMPNDENVTATLSTLNIRKKKDVYIFDDRNRVMKKIYSDLHDGYRSSNIIKDESQNIWYPAHSGLIKRQPHILTFSESSPDMISGLHTIAEDEQGKIWFGGYNQSGWSYWDGTSIKKPKDKKLLTNRVLPGAMLYNDKLWFFEEASTPSSLSYIQDNRLVSLEFPESVSPGFFFTKLKSGKIAAGLSVKGLLIFDPEKPSEYVIKNKDKGLLLLNILTISEDKNNRLWMGRMSQGIACYDPARDTIITWLISPENPESLGMIASKTDSNGDLWMGTAKGLYILHEPHRFDIMHQSLFNHIKYVPLPGDYHDRVNSIGENRRYLIACTDKGIHLLDKTVPPDVEGRRRAYSFWFGEDIPGKGSEQNAVLVDSKGYLWVGTNEGALRFDINNMSFDTTPTTLRLTSVKIGGTEVNPDTYKITGPQGQRSLDLTWVAEGNHHFQNNVYATILILTEKNDTVYFKEQTKDKNFNLPHLAPDTYRLIIKGYKNNQLGAVLEKKIVIPKLLSERAYFWAVSALLLTVIPFLFILNISRSRRKLAEYHLSLEKAKRSQDSYRIKSLSNFFNPHFINNALHWLQSKYRKDDETTSMIDSLAGNVEILYQNMQKGLAYHNLKNELALVNNYLEIQQVRFNYMLQIEQKMDVELDSANIFIPSMLLQIHVENAVEKGIRNRSGAGKLSISISEKIDELLLSIEDDGMGRKNNHTEDPDRKGSTQVMNDLISILNSYNLLKIKVTYDDHIFEETYGTRVNIALPKNFNYEFEKI